MNVDIETSHSENPLQQMPAQLVKYLEDLEKRSEEERRREIHERFRNIRCFQHILGTSTQFKLSYEKSMYLRAKVFIEPQKWGSAPVRLWKGSERNTMSMSLYSDKEPAFLTYVSNSQNEVTIFCPELQEPMGRLIKREDNLGADIFCLATNKTYEMCIIQADTPAAMRIIDSQGRVVAAANVSNWKTINSSRFGSTTYLNQFALQVDNGLSEPARVMLLVAFANWATWTCDEVRNENRMKKCIGFGIAIFIVVVILIVHSFYFRDY